LRGSCEPLCDATPSQHDTSLLCAPPLHPLLKTCLAAVQVDKMLLREMGCALIARNEHGRRQFGGSCSMPASNGHSNAAADRLAASPTAVPASAADNSGGSGCALVYLAHCKPELCNALLDANWTPAQLTSFAIIGRVPAVLTGFRPRHGVMRMLTRSRLAQVGA
jgi:hypothetical protein